MKMGRMVKIVCLIKKESTIETVSLIKTERISIKEGQIILTMILDKMERISIMMERISMMMFQEETLGGGT
jgi:hypothetical protein